MNFLGPRRSGHHAVLFWLAEQIVRPTRMKMDYTNRNITRFTGGVGEPLVIFNYENPPSVVVSTPGPTIVVLREIRNNVASWTKLMDQPFNFDAYRELAESVCNDVPDLFIYYDRWFTDKAYRRSIINKANELSPAVFADTCINSVKGIGSSFDGYDFHGAAPNMNVLERYKQVNMPPIPADVLTLSERVEAKVCST